MVIAAYLKEEQMKSYTLGLWELKNKNILGNINQRVLSLTYLFVHSEADFTLWLLPWLLLLIIEAHLAHYILTKAETQCKDTECCLGGQADPV